MSLIDGRCKDCGYFDPNPTGGEYGKCRFYPATCSAERPDTVGRWPTVAFDDWCGLFTPWAQAPPPQATQLLAQAPPANAYNSPAVRPHHRLPRFLR